MIPRTGKNAIIENRHYYAVESSIDEQGTSQNRYETVDEQATPRPHRHRRSHHHTSKNRTPLVPRADIYNSNTEPEYSEYSSRGSDIRIDTQGIILPKKTRSTRTRRDERNPNSLAPEPNFTSITNLNDLVKNVQQSATKNTRAEEDLLELLEKSNEAITTSLTLTEKVVSEASRVKILQHTTIYIVAIPLIIFIVLRILILLSAEECPDKSIDPTV